MQDLHATATAVLAAAVRVLVSQIIHKSQRLERQTQAAAAVAVVEMKTMASQQAAQLAVRES